MRIVLVGAGGQAREMRWILEDLRRAGEDVAYRGCVISDAGRSGAYDSRDEILGDFEWLRRNRGEWDGLALAIGNAAARLRVADELEGAFGVDVWPRLVHPTAIFDRDSATIGHGALVHPGVVGTVNLVIEPHAMINNACTLGHEARIGRACVVNPGANIAGGVVIGAGVLVGTGAQVLQYLTVGDGARIGAGAVVTRDVPGGVTVVGIPAKEKI